MMKKHRTGWRRAKTWGGYTIWDVEISAPLPAMDVPEGICGVAIILRREGRPIAFLMKEMPGGKRLPAEEIRRLIRKEVKSHLLEDPRRGPRQPFPHLGLFPSLTVAICTKDHPEDLSHCLGHLFPLQQDGEGGIFEILVVDNAPSDDRSGDLVASWNGVRYVMESKPGLNFARNRALQEAKGEIVAFIDDDVIVDKYWLRGLRQVLAQHPDAGAVTGLVLPYELATDAQILFEKRGGFEKNFETIRYGQDLPGHPFYPCVGGKFGTGCNMAFPRKILLELGGFDEALDTGPPLPGGGDTDMLYRVVRAGYPIVYEPQFMVFHKHRRSIDQLRRQYCRSWGQGLMAFVAKSYRSDIPQRSNLRRLIAWWFGYRMRELMRSVLGNHVLPPEMVLAELWGGIVGLLVAYPRSVKRMGQIRKQYS